MSSIRGNKITFDTKEASVSQNKLTLVNAVPQLNKLFLGEVGENVNENVGNYSYRQFYLYNENDEYLNLNEAPMMLLSPEGLGINFSPDFNDLSSGFFRKANTGKIPQGNIVCDILFEEVNALPNTAYSTYRDFVDFVMNAEKLYLGYIPAKNVVSILDEYRCEVEIEYINKSQINFSKCLRCPVSFKMLTPWYKTTTVQSTFEFSEDVSNVSLPAAQGHMPAGVKLTFSRRGLSFLSFELIGNTTHKTYGRCDITASISNTENVIYSSVVNDCYVLKRDGTFGPILADLMDKVEITYNPWFRLPTNEATTLKVTLTRSGAQTYTEAGLEVEIFNYYRSV